MSEPDMSVVREFHPTGCACSICRDFVHAGPHSWGLLAPAEKVWNAWRWGFYVRADGIWYLRWNGFWQRRHS